MCGAGLQPGTYFTLNFTFYDFFYTLQTPIFRNIWESVHLRTLHFFLLQCVKQELTPFISLFLQKIKRPSTNWLLLIVIDKLTIIASSPFSLVTKGAFVIFGKICLCVKSHSFIFSLIPCCPLFLKLNAQFLWYLRLPLRPVLQIR